MLQLFDMRETGAFELASTITLVLQENQLTKCASHPQKSVDNVLLREFTAGANGYVEDTGII